MAHLFEIFMAIALVPFVSAASTSPSPSPSPDTCYSCVGCFTNLPPWASPSRPALPPQDPINVSSFMYFYSSDSPDGIVFPVFPEIDLSKVPYDGNRTIFMIFHGYKSSATDPWILTLKDILLRRADANVFVADYGEVSRGSFEQAAGDVRVVARLGALVIEAIGADPSNVHMIGHSLGAHVAAYTANSVEEAGKPFPSLYIKSVCKSKILDGCQGCQNSISFMRPFLTTIPIRPG